jgi:type II secretory pathway component PulM
MMLGRRERITLFVGVPVVLVALMYKLAFAPSLDRLSQLNAAIADMQDQLERAKRYASQQVSLDNDIQDLKKSINSRGVTFDLFGFIIDAASDANIRDRCEANPSAPGTRLKLEYKPTLVNVTLQGVSLKELTDFLYRIHAADKLLIVDPIEISVPSSGGGGGLSVTMTVSTLVRS